MCNNVSVPSKPELIKKIPNIPIPFDIEKTYNVLGYARPLLPVQFTPDRLDLASWKYIPNSVKDEATANKLKHTVNARADKLTTVWKKSLHQRCLLWVDGFYEPHHPSPDITEPYYIYMPGHEPFTMGCVFNIWTNEKGETYPTFAIITTTANELLKQVHNEKERMPVIIPPDQRERWLHRLEDKEVLDLCQPYHDGVLLAHEVANFYKKGNPKNSPETQLPIQKPNTLF